MRAVLRGSCHCGAVRITIPRKPDYINDCNCSLCVKKGANWCYFTPAEVLVEGGPLHAYVRADCAEPCLTTHSCATCGCTTHWSPLEPQTLDRMGVNAGLFEPGDMDGIEVRPIDGRSWDV